MLAEELSSKYANAPDAIVLGIPRGGVIVAEEIAQRLGLPLDVVIASKVGAPSNPEYAIGAVDADGAVTLNERAGYRRSEVEHLARPVREKIEKRLMLYRGGREPLEFENATVILVDDGIATGLTAIAAIDYLRRHWAARIVLSVPVIAADSATTLRDRVDDLVAIEVPDIFYAVGQYYSHFEQTSDDEVLTALNRAASSAES